MKLNFIQDAVEKGNLEWNKHALARALERKINRDEVKQVLTVGEIIESYESDRPLPSCLILGWTDKKPCHVVVAYNEQLNYCYIITVYIPDDEHFYQDFKTRK
jgi:hypothetical protein